MKRTHNAVGFPGQMERGGLRIEQSLVPILVDVAPVAIAARPFTADACHAAKVLAFP